MGRRNVSTSFIVPIKSDGTVQTEGAATFGRGSFTLASGTTYYFPLDGKDGQLVSAHLQWDSSIVITSITVQDSNMPESTDNTVSTGTGVSDFSSVAGEWLTENPAGSYVPVAGAGVTATLATVAATGGAQGGCMYHIGFTAARRSRIAVVVGATGGAMRCATWGKE